MLSTVASNLSSALHSSSQIEEDEVIVPPEINYQNYMDHNMEEGKDLITIELQNALRSDDGSQLTTVAVRFDSLDMMLNCESWIAVLDFLQQLKPPKSTEKESKQTQALVESNASSGHIEVVLDFHKLNILLLRHISQMNKNYGRKIGILAMHDTQIIASVNQEASEQGLMLEIQGSVGCVGLKDLTFSSKGKLALCVGDIIEDDDIQSPGFRKPAFYYTELQRAFTFSFKKYLKKANKQGKGLIFDLEDCDESSMCKC